MELSQLVKALESELGVSAAAAMPMAMPGMAMRARAAARRRRPRRRPSSTSTSRKWARQDQGHQGGARGHEPRAEGSQGPGRERAEAAEGRREQGRGGGDQEEVRRRRRQGRDQVRSAGLPPLGELRTRRPTLGTRYARLYVGRDPRVQAEPAGIFRDFDPRGSATDVQPSQERLPRTQGLLEDQDDGSDSEPDRDPAEVVRAIPADEPPSLGTGGRRPAVGVQVGLPDQRFPRELVARVHRVFDRQLGVQVRQAGGAPSPAQAVQQLRRHADRRSLRRPRGALPALRQGEPGARRRLRHLRPHGRDEAEVRRRRVPGARHDLRRPAQGDHPARRLEQGPGDRRQDDPRHQGAGGLLRRHPADDGQRHVHHQRHRARHRVAAPPVAGRVLPLRGQDALRRADHPVPRLVGGVRVRPEEPALRPHRPEAEVPGLGVPARARPARRRRDHPDVLLGRSHLPEPGPVADVGGQRQPGRAARGRRRQGGRLLGPGRQEDHAPTRSPRSARRASRRSASRTKRSRARLPPPTSSIPKPAR